MAVTVSGIRVPACVERARRPSPSATEHRTAAATARAGAAVDHGGEEPCALAERRCPQVEQLIGELLEHQWQYATQPQQQQLQQSITAANSPSRSPRTLADRSSSSRVSSSNIRYLLVGYVVNVAVELTRFCDDSVTEVRLFDPLALGRRELVAVSASRHAARTAKKSDGA
jgi:hypothetical protein